MSENSPEFKVQSQEPKVERPEFRGESPRAEVEHLKSTGGEESGRSLHVTNESSVTPNDQVPAASVKRGSGYLRFAPTMITLASLLGIGYWGHHHDWKIPKFSELGGQASTEQDDWCEAHSVPESICIACNADLMPKGELHGWCKEHGVAECVLEHPEIAQLKSAPKASSTDLARAARGLAVRQRPENNRACKLHLRRIQFADENAVEKVGVDIRLAELAPIVEAISANGEITFDPTRVARLASRASGTVWRVHRSIGDPVRQGDVLALIDSAEVGRAKAELLQAIAHDELTSRTYVRLAKLDGVVPGRELQEAEADRAKAAAGLQMARQSLVNLGLVITPNDIQDTPQQDLMRHLQFLGLPSEAVAGLDPDRTTGNLLPVVAPRDGVVVRRDVVAGEVVDTTRLLFTIVDTSRMWLTLRIPMEDARLVRVGQRVLFHPDGMADTHAGEITWTSPEVDPVTRTVSVRAELENSDGHLLHETFGRGQVVLREEPNAVVAPKSAVHWEGCCHVVFVRDKDFLKEGAYKVFHTRMVRPGVAIGDDQIELLAGVLPGEVVVTKGSSVLRAELLKGNLGAG